MKHLRRFVSAGIVLAGMMACAQQTYNSWSGNSIAGILPSNSHMRTLNIFVNIIYDQTSDPQPAQGCWPPITDTTLQGINNTCFPTYLNDFIDTVYVCGNTRGTITRLYGESSFDCLQIIGDFMVVNIPESYIIRNSAFDRYGISSAVISYINSHGGVQTIYGRNRISDYGNNRVEYINMLVRNITRDYGGYGVGEGSSNCNFNQLRFGDAYYPCHNGTYQCVGNGDISVNPSNIVPHEISHSFFGSNSFHTSGGNHRGSGETMPFMTLQGGYGLMGAANSSLVCCNGYERWRMHWRNPQCPESAGYIYAKDEDDDYVVSDISKEDGNKTFILRDFVTNGDAIRIKLPYKDSLSSLDQYIWLENHQLYSDKLDFLQYSNTYECRPGGNKGVYAYYQVGRDVLTGTSEAVWDYHTRDNLRMIPAEGYWNYSKHDVDDYSPGCVDWNQYDFELVRGQSNPFCGYSDLEKMLFPTNDDNTIDVSMEKEMKRKTVGSQQDDALAFFGDNLDGFDTHCKINMSTNPSTCNAKTFFNRMNNTNISAMTPSCQQYNTMTTYLSGLSIEMTPCPNGNVVVDIRWDDYDITNSANWTGRICLKEKAVINHGHTVDLVRNLTPIQHSRSSESGVFSPSTELICDAGSVFILDNQSRLNVKEQSSIVLKKGATMIIRDDARLSVYPERCALIMEECSKIIIEDRGLLEIGNDAIVDIDPRAMIAVNSVDNISLPQNWNCGNGVVFSTIQQLFNKIEMI